MAQLHLDSLAPKRRKKDVMAALQNLSNSLHKVYDGAMERIISQVEDDKNFALRVLYWISNVKRPLDVRELQHAIAFEDDGTAEIDDDALTHEDILVSLCAGLVTIDQGSSVIRLVHFTTHEYFEQTHERHFRNVKPGIAMTCLQRSGTISEKGTTITDPIGPLLIL